MIEKILIPVLVSFGIATLLGPIVIPFLRRLKVGQTEREELKSHQVKTGTPTMGGVIILASVIVTSIALGIMLSTSRHAAFKGDKEAIRQELNALPVSLHNENPSQL